MVALLERFYVSALRAHFFWLSRRGVCVGSDKLKIRILWFFVYTLPSGTALIRGSGLLVLCLVYP